MKHMGAKICLKFVLLQTENYGYRDHLKLQTSVISLKVYINTLVG